MEKSKLETEKKRFQNALDEKVVFFAFDSASGWLFQSFFLSVFKKCSNLTLLVYLSFIQAYDFP